MAEILGAVVGGMLFLESYICLLKLCTLAKTFGDIIVFSLLGHCWFEKFPVFHIKLFFSITHLKHFQRSFYVITTCLVSRRFINLCEALSLFRGIIADEPICCLFISIFHVSLPFLCLAVCGWQRGSAVGEKAVVLDIAESEENGTNFETWKICCNKYGNYFKFTLWTKMVKNYKPNLSHKAKFLYNLL